MRKKILAILLAVVMAAGLLPGTAQAAGTAPTEKQVYETIIALKSSYPEGMPWNESNSYTWKGGNLPGGLSETGTACQAFAFLLSDAAFGDLPALQRDKFEFSDVRVGDILSGYNHAVVILEVRDNGVVIAEGNYNGTVHWGRTMTKDQVLDPGYSILTRYPESTVTGTCGTNATWTFQDGVLTIEGAGPVDINSVDSGLASLQYGGLYTMVITDGITSIGESAFWFCTKLAGATISDSVTSIGDSAFADCRDLTSVTIGNGVTSIEYHAFYGCSSLTSVTIGSGVTSIDSYALRYCLNLTDIYYGGSEIQWGKIVSIRMGRNRAFAEGGQEEAGLGRVTVHYNSPIPSAPAAPAGPTEPTEPTEPKAPQFTDVPAGIWYADTVNAAVERGLIKGVGGGKFDPTGILTRASAITILARLAGEDVSGSALWYQKAVDWAKANDISDGEDPNGDITREELAVMLWRFTDAPNAADRSVLDKYPDTSSISSEALEAMAWAVENGIIKGSDGKWAPQGTADRSQAITMIMRYCDKFDK